LPRLLGGTDFVTSNSLSGGENFATDDGSRGLPQRNRTRSPFSVNASLPIFLTQLTAFS
jgi:hypothetical protein